MPCVGSNPILAAKPKCALRLVECGVKGIDKIEVICQSRKSGRLGSSSDASLKGIIKVE